jgi:D-glucosaminate-6-phosphate ammonia-lyase
MEMGVYERLGVRRVINASGMMTALGGSTISDTVGQAMAEAGREQVEIEALQRAVGRAVAEALDAEDAMATCGAAAGIALMVAACIAGDDLARIEALPDVADAPNEVLLQAGHAVNFGAPVVQMIRLGGGRVRRIGSVNAVTEAHLRGGIGDRTAAMLFVQSHHSVQKGMLALERCVDVCRDARVPLLIDAAAEEDLRFIAGCGADLVTLSGGKAIGGPASGLVVGRADLVTACRAQSRGIGRAMKIGKETLVGLCEAFTEYAQRSAIAEHRRQREIVDQLVAAFQAGTGLEVRRLADEAGRGIERAAVVLEPQRARELVRFLHGGDPPIYPREHLVDLGFVAFDPRPLSLPDIAVISRRVQEFLQS